MNDKTFRHQMYGSLIEENIKRMTNIQQVLLKHIETFRKTFSAIYKVAYTISFDYSTCRLQMDKLKKTLDENEVFGYDLSKSISAYKGLFSCINLQKNPFIKNYVDTIVISLNGMEKGFKQMRQYSQQPGFFEFIYSNEH